MKIIGVIPARYHSQRFPGKPLTQINGKTMIRHVYERAIKSRVLDDLIVATDSHLIQEEVQSFGGHVMLTSVTHASGSERVAEVADKIDGDFFINIQGDEPLINPLLLDDIAMKAIEFPNSVVTAKLKLIGKSSADNPNIVKVVTDKADNALYFSRSRIPYNRSNEDVELFKHIGIYGFPKKILQGYTTLPRMELEKAEMLEQLRFLENGINIKVIETMYDSYGVDVKNDVLKIEAMMR
ncbi:MAG: 3-deoxy-manno-octulosonate cytidylyltransferase [Sporolactobacillus sp.]